MASSAVSCASICGPSQLLPDDLQDDSSSYCHNAPHHALAEMVSTAQQLAALEALSVSAAGPPCKHLLIQASIGTVYDHCEAAEAFPSPLQPRKLHAQHQQTPALAACLNVLQTQQQTPCNQHQYSCKHCACRCLYPTTNSVSKAAAVVSTAPESAAEELATPPAHTSAALESRARHISSSTNGQRRVQQWLSNMELRLQVPDTPLLPLESPCPGPRAGILAHEDSILAHRDEILAQRGSILAHSEGVLVQRRFLAQSGGAAAEAGSSAATAAVSSKKRPSTSPGEAAAAALLAEFNSTCKRCRTSSSSSPSQQQQQRNLSCSSSRTSAAAIAASVVSQDSKDVTRSLEPLPPPMFVIMGFLSREAASL